MDDQRALEVLRERIAERKRRRQIPVTDALSYAAHWDDDWQGWKHQAHVETLMAARGYKARGWFRPTVNVYNGPNYGYRCGAIWTHDDGHEITLFFGDGYGRKLYKVMEARQIGVYNHTVGYVRVRMAQPHKTLEGALDRLFKRVPKTVDVKRDSAADRYMRWLWGREPQVEACCLATHALMRGRVELEKIPVHVGTLVEAQDGYALATLLREAPRGETRQRILDALFMSQIYLEPCLYDAVVWHMGDNAFHFPRKAARVLAQYHRIYGITPSGTIGDQVRHLLCLDGYDEGL